ncbi:DUF6415 family natural product biosynthesis protein [Streptomyces coffeae]|uniref:Uncharacterized protein n=1 Tax=Streptomyces coffeae TaxID=621382 RepID=A0ABS1N7E2_9ACTN|nr:DUF6415 family natural product biosynthesis protein [Streptomyces coffeae]MBL1095933.1 hypothetical protein [Streptomyces coffeae]
MEKQSLRVSDSVDLDAIKTAISRALAEQSVLPPYDELCEMHRALVGHIEVLMPVAAKQIDGMWHGSVEWYQRRSKLDTIPHEVTQGLGAGLQSAAWRVKTLGYTCRWLLEVSGLSNSAGAEGA